MMKRKLFDAGCHGIGGLWRKFPSEQTGKNTKQSESRSEKFRKNKLVFWVDVVPGRRSNTKNQMLEWKCQPKKNKINFIEKINVYTNFLRIYVNWNAILWLINLYIIFSTELRLHLLLSDSLTKKKKFQSLWTCQKWDNIFDDVPQALICSLQFHWFQRELLLLNRKHVEHVHTYI